MPPWQAALALELDELTGVTADDEGFRHAPVVPGNDEAAAQPSTA